MIKKIILPKITLPLVGAFLIIALLAINGCTPIRPSLGEIGTPEAPIVNFDYSSYERLLEKFVDDNGMVNYRKLVENPEDLNRFYAQIASYSPDSHPHLFPTESSKLAYWINSYNSSVMRGVVEHYPIDSVAAVRPPLLLFFFPSKSGFFFFQRFTYGGVETSLYYLENHVIRDRFKDPRFHFALNCASKSCATLPREPFSSDAKKLERQLERETEKFIRSKNNVRYIEEENTIYLSSIFKWYKSDFLNWLKHNHPEREAGLADYVLPYLDKETADVMQKNISTLKVRFLTYDWGLNDQQYK